MSSPARLSDAPHGSADPDVPGDAELIARAAAGDARALEAFYDRYARLVFAFALRILGDRGLAEEVLQEAFFRVWQRGGAYHPSRGAPVTWLLSITHNLAIDEVRKRRRRPQRSDDDDLDTVLAGIAAGGPSVEDEVGLGEAGAALRAALARLPPAQRSAIELAYFQGLSQREIALAQGAPLGTIKTRIQLGMAKLRGELVGQEPVWP
jgi:RNA polymerase sigma-70 factor (ECF subfamily)